MFCFMLHLSHFHRVSIVKSVLEWEIQCSKRKTCVTSVLSIKGEKIIYRSSFAAIMLLI